MRVGSQLAAYYEMNLLDFDLYMSLVRSMSTSRKGCGCLADERNIPAVSREECAA